MALAQQVVAATRELDRSARRAFRWFTALVVGASVAVVAAFFAGVVTAPWGWCGVGAGVASLLLVAGAEAGRRRRAAAAAFSSHWWRETGA